MVIFNPNPAILPRILATDLDGTFIPLPGNAENQAALEHIREACAARLIGLVFATGRHLESVLEAIQKCSLPPPDWIVCDVGTAIYRNIGGGFELFAPFEALLAAQTRGADRTAVETLLAGVDGLSLQPLDRQARFKISYDSTAEGAGRLAALVNQRLADAQLPYACLASIDPLQPHGLLDVLPAGASKAAALLWLASHADFSPDEVVFAGDSGNDLAALACGFRAIVVANAPNGLAEQARQTLAARGQGERLFQATRAATSGVLEGCRHFGLVSA